MSYPASMLQAASTNAAQLSHDKADTFAYFLFGCGAGLVVVGGLVTFVRLVVA